MTTATSGKDDLETLRFFLFDGEILGSRHQLIPEAKLEARFPRQGAKIASELSGYHPLGGRYLKLEILPSESDPEPWLQATKFGTGWSEQAQELFSKLQFVPSPSGFRFLVPRKLDPKIHKLNSWQLNYAKIEGGPNPYYPEAVPDGVGADDARARKVVLVWSYPGFDEYVYTCWNWG